MQNETEERLTLIAMYELCGVSLAKLEEMQGWGKNKASSLLHTHREKVTAIKTRMLNKVLEEYERVFFSMTEIMITEIPNAVAMIIAGMKGEEWQDYKTGGKKAVTLSMANSAKALLSLFKEVIADRRKEGKAKEIREHSGLMQHMITADIKERAIENEIEAMAAMAEFQKIEN